MAGSSGEPRRAITPLSSPPQRINYRFRESSYYTDDQSDDCYAGDRGEKTTAGSNIDPDSGDDYDSDDDHEQHCSLHNDPLATHCNSMTQTRKKCSRKAKVFTEGFLPVCAMHNRRWWCLEAGRCQAVEECGYLCKRFATHAPPYHLCAKHEKGTDTLPCGIMSLPTEIHLMICRYLFPDVVHPTTLTGITGSVLRVNRALYQAASTILYSEAEYKASVTRSAINFLGRTWYTNGINAKHSDIAEALCQTGAQRVRKIHVEISFGHGYTRTKGIGINGISAEDHELYQVRDIVGKFVDMLRPSLPPYIPTLKQIRVRPAPQVAYTWQTDEVIAAVFFVVEPFKALGPIDIPKLLPCPKPTPWHVRLQPAANIIGDLHKDQTYRRLRKSWLRSMNTELGSPNNIRREGDRNVLVTREYHSIEQLYTLIRKHEHSTSGKHGWISTSLQGMERVLHIARVVEMNVENDVEEDLERMRQIREAIMKRWVNAHREQQLSLSTIASCIDGMFHSDSEEPSATFPDAFEFKMLDPLEQETPINSSWLELGDPDVGSRLGETGVTYTEDDFRIYIHKDGKTCVRLKTPGIVRKLRALGGM